MRLKFMHVANASTTKTHTRTHVIQVSGGYTVKYRRATDPPARIGQVVNRLFVPIPHRAKNPYIVIWTPACIQLELAFALRFSEEKNCYDY